MLRTTRRNSNSKGRKTLKRQVYAQKGGARWFTLENDTDDTRLKNWQGAIAAAVEKGILPESLNQLTNPDAAPQQQLDAFIDAHRYQDTLLNLSINIAKKQVNIPEELSITTASENIEKLTSDLDTLARYYAFDVISFLRLPLPQPSTDKITYLFTERKISISDILLEPTIFKNMMVDSIANIFISLKQDNSDITYLNSQVTNPKYDDIIKLYGKFWKKYTDKRCVDYTGSFLTGSFYLTQQKDEFTNEIVAGANPFFRQFADLIVKDKNSIKEKECKNYFYIPQENNHLWVDLVSDICKIYLTTAKVEISDIIKLFNVATYDNKPPCNNPNGISTTFVPTGTEESNIVKTDVTANMLLSQIDPPLLSFVLHLLQVINENETLLMKQIEASGDDAKVQAFKTKFGRA